jgi:site-specific DNA recombinase
VRVAIYCRVSTDEQRKHGYSIADQKRTLTEHAERCGMEVVGPPLVDEGISADNLTRPGLREIYRLAEAGEIDAAIATYRDRYFRKQLYRLMADEDLEEFGVRLMALNDRCCWRIQMGPRNGIFAPSLRPD